MIHFGLVPAVERVGQDSIVAVPGCQSTVRRLPRPVARYGEC